MASSLFVAPYQAFHLLLACTITSAMPKSLAELFQDVNGERGEKGWER
jgi:hypothetical protein